MWRRWPAHESDGNARRSGKSRERGARATIPGHGQRRRPRLPPGTRSPHRPEAICSCPMLGRSRLRSNRLALKPQTRELAGMTYYVTASDGTDIAYDCTGEGNPIVLIHGFGANRLITWANTNWFQTLTRAGHKLIAIDCRGHGESEKPHDPEDYDEGRMAMDVIAVLAALEIPEVDVMGYSMSAQLAIRLMHDAPGRVRRGVLGGGGENYFCFLKERADIISRGLLAKDPAKISDPVAKEFRLFCEKAGDDLLAMAACIRRPRQIFSAEELHILPQPVLVVDGAEDNLIGSSDPLALTFRDGRLVIIPQRHHHSN